MVRKPRSSFLPLLLAASLAGCAATSVIGRGPAKTADELYARGMQDLADELYPEALADFSELKTKHPYSKFAALADLRTADTHFARGKYLEAIDTYRQFLKFHPNHEEAPYALFRIGESYFEQIPEDWFFLPPSAEKDQVNTRLAISAYRDVIGRYPGHEYAKKAAAQLEEGRKKLAEHELYVARFYWKRDKYQAVVMRAEGLVRDYPGLGFDAEALWLAARAQKALGARDQERALLEKLVSGFPDSQEADLAKRRLSELGAPS